MSDKFKLPVELTTIENQLQSLPLSESTIDRDELMYQAGWAAAVAEASTQTVSDNSWFWRTSTGILAIATTLLAIGLFSQTAEPHDTSSTVASNGSQPPSALSQEVSPPPTASQFVSEFGATNDPDSWANYWSARQRKTANSNRRQLSVYHWRHASEQDYFSASDTDGNSGATKTAHELFKELLSADADLSSAP